MAASVIGLVGNPNCGKTTLFNILTGTRQRVGNWPGVTVEKKTGQYGHAGRSVEVVDLPGTYALTAPDGDGALDERIAQSFLVEGGAGLIVNIVDASNLERNLYLTAQLLEMRLPVVVALNMMDVAKDRRIRIDVDRLARRLGCPVVPIVAARRQGIEVLKDAIVAALDEPRAAAVDLPYPAAINDAVAALAPLLAGAGDPAKDRRWLAVRLLEGDGAAMRMASAEAVADLPGLRRRIEEHGDEEPDILIAAARYAWVHDVVSDVMTRTGEVRRSVSDRIDRIVLNRALGIPIFLVVMYAMFMFTINIGGAFIDFFDLLFGAIFVDGAAAALSRLGSPAWLTTLLADGVGGGIQTVATFIPVIGFLFLFLSALEDSGYMARAAFVMDRFMRTVGLPGKSFVPLIVGFGCNVPAIMAARTLENQRDRTMTIVMAPFMSCGARLPVYALFAAAFFPIGGQNLVFGLYLIGIAAAVLTGLALKRTLLQGDSSPFIMELPPYHLPAPGNVLLRTWDRLKGFIIRAGRVIVGVVVVIAFLNSWGSDGSFGNQDSDRSVLAAIGRTMVPVFAPMGISDDNWPATVGIFTGILAKEAVVGTLNSLYTGLAENDAGAPAASAPAAASPSLADDIAAAFATIPANLAAALAALGDPLGLGIGDVSSVEAAAQGQNVATGTFTAMAARFDGAAGAFAYLLMVLLYMPCVAATAAVYRETNLQWTLFVCGWTTLMGYTSAVLFYQVATFARDPVIAGLWILGMLAVFAAALTGMWVMGRREPLPGAVIVPGT
ncbi:MAG: Fe(2+) transporter permease subunit FeoB [Rhodospirillales bacterium]|nr:Fe(2+) transporter permease subunit FeoB [Rhodospirillales bacterium]